MGERRQFEVLLLRLVPHALRDDFMTVGVVVVENSRQPSETSHQPSAVSHQENLDRRQPSAISHQQDILVDGDDHSGGGASTPTSQGEPRGGSRFADLRVTRDWRRVECFAPEFELETLELVEATVRERLGEIESRAQLLQLLEERFGTLFDVGPVKALVAEDPAAEMRILERDYLAPMRPAERVRRLGRMGIVSRMQDAFAEAGVLEMLQRDLDMREFTGENDPFRVDFGFRVGKSLKMFQGLALNVSREPAVTLAYRYGRIREGMRGRGEQALMTAVVSEAAARAAGETGSGIAMLRANEVEVRGLEEMGEIAESVRREMRA